MSIISILSYFRNFNNLLSLKISHFFFRISTLPVRVRETETAVLQQKCLDSVY